MKAIMVLYDSLNRHMLPPYGCKWTQARSFERLADRSVTFDQCWSGSMPCMPARRDLHTGRYNFLHRTWGPLEPFDDSVPEILKENGIYTHLVTDHYHYFQAGGANYHTKYTTWEGIRGQEGDPWIGQVHDPHLPDSAYPLTGFRADYYRQDFVNRDHMKDEKSHSQTRTFDAGVQFIRTNHDDDNWFLQIECFDPHEPFFVPRRYRDLYSHGYHGRHFDWPHYRRVVETEEEVRHIRMEYGALLSMCDRSLGRILDEMDRYEMWSDTMLIVTTDHGYLLGEHGWWAKDIQPFYNEVVRIPLFVADPRSPGASRSNRLAQLIDIGPTLLDYFGLQPTTDMQGVPLRDAISRDAPTRSVALFGDHGGYVCCTDGRYVYMRAPKTNNLPLYHYTLMPLFYDNHFTVEELLPFEVVEPMPFSKGLRLIRFPAKGNPTALEEGTLLYDLADDPNQTRPLDDETIETRLAGILRNAMIASDAPVEQFVRLGLLPPERTT